ncbi:unnamed protein product [Schistocephalus solidus]|uniref:GST_C domain-containing protein n=1 Tax=Schistocephalus solidus TaxID=70667 RepID=A0A183TIC4_SCHSO|nr:unnamed protein product [Schistocephalus solidus]
MSHRREGQSQSTFQVPKLDIPSQEKATAIVENDVYALMLSKAADVHLHLKNAYITEKLDTLLEFMKEMTGPFIGGKSLTIADLELLILQDLVDRAYPNLKHDVKERLTTLRSNVFRDRPALERYYKSRPQTEF